MAHLNRYESSRSINDILEGTDAAYPLIESSSLGDLATVQKFLSDSNGVEIARQSPHRIYSEDRPKSSENDVRGVLARPIQNVEFALAEAAKNGHAAAVSALLTFAIEYGINTSIFLEDARIRSVVGKITKRGDLEVFKAFVAANHDVINMNLLHGARPLDQAVAGGHADFVAFLLEHGADSKPSYEYDSRNSGYTGSLLSDAAKAGDARITELLLRNGVTPVKSGGLHRAAELGAVDIMRVLIQHGADVNEQLSEKFITGAHDPILGSWTPLHFAASKNQDQAIPLLESHGARSDIKDRRGRTPAMLRKNP